MEKKTKQRGGRREGAGRHCRETKKYSIMLTDDDNKLINHLAEKYTISRSEVIKRSVIGYAKASGMEIPSLSADASEGIGPTDRV